MGMKSKNRSIEFMTIKRANGVPNCISTYLD